MDKKLIISIVQAIYIIYMFNYFETTYSFETSRQLSLSGIFLHPIKILRISFTYLSIWTYDGLSNCCLPYRSQLYIE